MSNRTWKGWTVRTAFSLCMALLTLAGPTTAPLARAEAKPDLEIQVSTVAHPKTSVRWGRAEGLVEAPLEDVRRIVHNYGAYQEFLPNFRASRVLSQRGPRALVYMEAAVARNTLTIWAQMKISQKRAAEREIIEAHMLKGNLDHMEALWELTPVDATHTRVAFQILVDPKVPLPASLVTRENEKASKRTIGALRKRLLQQG